MLYYAGIGSRQTPQALLPALTDLARDLAGRGYVLRSGAADGADAAFEAGAGDAKEVWLPWKGFNGHTSPLLPSPEAFDLAARFHPEWPRCGRGARALHARNGHQILGADLDTPVDFVVCWTLDGGWVGGTAQALRMADAHGIPVYNLGLGLHVLDRLRERLQTPMAAAQRPASM
jgi:hypothetical protein